ncbi:redoxin domain-containing protein [Sporosarcina sp. Marseille-Q4063]|uniref:peroxiredoxin family protein n=1 Tax=Sporosarcina sp. Marseille-Q4063 TaxID=2810514 RepID=UPI001BAE721B|nr:redoxin domain-containing protein [Sporosarcina sp. Marseille-Q4063]QUW21649.1 redoxin domain-containing protein [Sporosarcina sp. Marseille-Q4063]
MNKKMIGYLIAVLVIGSMIVITVKSNMEKNAPTDQVASVDESGGEKTVGLEHGNLPPDFDLTTISGDQVNLADLKGKKVILNFWASWCGPCKAEMPHMEKYYEKNKEDANVEIIAVNMTNTERRGLKGVEEFIDDYGLTFPIPLDKDGKVERMYEIVSIPTTFMLGTNGEIVHKIIGPMDEKMMEDLVNNLK